MPVVLLFIRLGPVSNGELGVIYIGVAFALAFVAAIALWRRAREGHGPAVVALALPWALSFLYIASIAYWYADGGPASRYLLATMPFLVAALAGGIETILAVGRGRDVLVGVAAALAGWSAFITYVLAVLPELRYDYAPEIRAGAAARLWVFLGRILRPEPDSVFPSLLRTDLTSIALSLVWVAVALALLVVGPRLRARVSG